MAKPQYGPQHQRERAAIDANLAANGPTPCRRCGQPIHADRHANLNWDARKFDLGHPDPGQDTKAPEHATCNREAGGREGRRRQTQPSSQEWW